MLKSRIAAGDRLVGTVLKTPHYGLIEVLGGPDLDFVMIDTEHSPFSTAELDRCILASRAVDLPVLVRLVEGTPAAILQVLDMGAAGIVVPQVDTAAEAKAIVQATRYGPGGRGFAGTTRAGGFGTIPASDLIERANDVVVVVQIESAEGVANASAIAQTTGVDACFVGRADLAVSQGLPLNAPVIESATEETFQACVRNKVALMMFVSDISECAGWFGRGARIIAVGSEHKAMQSYFSAGTIGSAKG